MIPILQSNTLKPSFQLPFRDLGGGVVSTAEIMGGATATFTRATAAAAKLSTGLWKLDVASGSPRFSYSGASTAVSTIGGYFPELAASQLALNPRDMTQAAWIAVTMTTAQTSTGIDGASSSCTRITAGGANATILQTLIAAASSRTYSCFVKRVTGTGTIILKHGTATLDITASINSSTYTRVELPDNELNVAYGIQINTSGDALDVDCNQFELGARASSPIPAAGTRNGDTLDYAFVPSASTGTFFMQVGPVYGFVSPIQLINGGDNNGRYLFMTGLVTTLSTQDADSLLQASISSIMTAQRKVAIGFGTATATLAEGGVATGGAFTSSFTNTKVSIGNRGGVEQPNGHIASVFYYPQRFPDTVLQSQTT